MTKNTFIAQEYITPACKIVGLSSLRPILDGSPVGLMFSNFSDDDEDIDM